MENIIFRSYKEGDAQQLSDLFNAAFAQRRTIKIWNWRYIESPGFEPEMCKIAEDRDKKKIVGVIYVNLIEKISINKEKYIMADINDVTTLPGYKTRGIASKLMQLSIDYMKQKGCDFSILSAGFKGFARRKLYQKFKYFDVERGNTFVQCPNILQLIKNVNALAFLFPVFFIFSYLPRFLSRIRIRFNQFFRDFTYEINHNKKHFEYMNALNMIIPKYYEGYPEYDKSKFIWARINVPTKQQEPTYILIRKRGKVIGGAVITHQYIYAKRLGIKIKLGILHEIFLDKNKFNNHRNMFFGYIYLIDKIMKAATRRSIGVLIFKSTLKDKDLNQAFNGLNFLTIRDTVIMVKELKSSLKFPQIKAPLYIPTYVSLGFP